MFGTQIYGAFLLASFLLHATPGLDTLFILAQCIKGGSFTGIRAALGISSGVLVHTSVVALGLAAWLANYPQAITVLSFAGFCYLGYLAIKELAISRRKQEASAPSLTEVQDAKRPYVEGLVTNVLNPKVALFFVAFLPAFVVPSQRMSPVPYFFLGTSFACTSFIWALVLIACCRLITKKYPRMRVFTKHKHTVLACVYAGLAVWVLLS